MKDGRRTNTRDHVINLTIDKIRLNGCEKISLRDIAKENNLSATALYRHFHNKDDLLNESLVQVSKDMYERYKSSLEVADDSNTKDKLLLLGETILNQFVQEPKLMDFLFFSKYACESHLTDKKTDFIFFDEYKKLIHQAKEQYQLETDEETLFIELWSFIQGYAMLVMNKITVYDRAIVEKAMDKFISDK